MPKMRDVLLVLALLLATSCATTTTTVSDEALAAQFDDAWAAYTAMTKAEPPDRPTWRARVQRTLHVEIAAPIEAVFALFSDVHRHTGLHPLVRQVVTHALIDLGDDVTERRFTAIEDIDLGVMVLPTATHAVTRIDRRRWRYTTVSWTDPATITRQLFVLRDLGNGVTRVDETITFESTGLLIGTVVDGGVSAHSRFMLGAKHRLEVR